MKEHLKEHLKECPDCRAEKEKIKSCIKKSTSETPLIATSPKEATIMESASPTKNSKACSISKGIKR